MREVWSPHGRSIFATGLHGIAGLDDWRHDLNAILAGHVMVVDGGAWLWREPMVQRGAVSTVSRSVESTSRQVGTAQSKL